MNANRHKKKMLSVIIDIEDIKKLKELVLDHFRLGKSTTQSQLVAKLIKDEYRKKFKV